MASPLIKVYKAFLESVLQERFQFRPVVGLPTLANLFVALLRTTGLDKGQAGLSRDILQKEGHIRVISRRPSVIGTAPSLDNLGVRLQLEGGTRQGTAVRRE